VFPYRLGGFLYPNNTSGVHLVFNAGRGVCLNHDKPYLNNDRTNNCMIRLHGKVYIKFQSRNTLENGSTEWQDHINN
jgi:hypothetical protein